MSTLTDILPAPTRKVVYTTYALVGLCLGAVQAGYGALSNVSPDWMKVALAVYAFIGTAVGATAASNVQPPPPGNP
jgi:uncharacterized membrane protein YfcA